VNRQQRFSFPHKQSEKVNIAGDMIYITLAEGRFDYNIEPPKKVLARETGHRYFGGDAIRQRAAHIREEPLDAKAPLCSSLIKCYFQLSNSSFSIHSRIQK
jgi:hypothetical protein